MEKNVKLVQTSELLKTASHELVDRSIELSERLLKTEAPARAPRGGRKGRALPIVQE
jgi:hypothetical protein